MSGSPTFDNSASGTICRPAALETQVAFAKALTESARAAGNCQVVVSFTACRSEGRSRRSSPRR